MFAISRQHLTSLFDTVWNTPNPLRYPLAQVFIENSTGERFIACLNH